MARFNNRDIIQGVSDEFQNTHDNEFNYQVEANRIIMHNESLKDRIGITPEDIARIDTINSTLRNNIKTALDNLDITDALYVGGKHKSKRTNKKRKTKRTKTKKRKTKQRFY